MPMIEWNDEFNVDIKIIDEQHRKLVDTINILHDAMSEGKGVYVLNQVFNNLMEYTTKHFQTEEEFMIMFGYPDYNEHKKEHDKCIEKVTEFKRKFDKNMPGIPVELSNFLVDWLDKHLIEMDQKYKDFFHKHGLE